MAGHYLSNKRWRYKRPDLRYAGKLRYCQKLRVKYQIYGKGNRWLPEEEEIVRDKIGTDRELCRILGRSIQAIQQKRSQLKNR